MLRILLIAACFLIGTSSAEAQFMEQIQRPQIDLSPSYPEPFETVEATLDAYAFDTSGAIIQWFVDGVEITDAQNSNTMTFEVGALGTENIITAQLTMPNGRVLIGSREITPARVDIIIEAETTKPLLYHGRALPSSGSTVRAIAIPRLGTTYGNLSYKWTFNNQVLAGGTFIGNDVVTFTAPKVGKEVLSVEVIDGRGRTLARKNIYVPVVEPEMYFYGDNPLRGLYGYAITHDFELIGEELLVRAEPYYMDANIFTENPRMQWEINGQEINNPSTDPQLITLRKAGGVGQFNVSFNILNRNNLIQNITEEFTVTF